MTIRRAARKAVGAVNTEQRAAAGTCPFRFRLLKEPVKAQRLDPAEILHQTLAILEGIPLFEVFQPLAWVFRAGIAGRSRAELLFGTVQN